MYYLITESVTSTMKVLVIIKYYKRERNDSQFVSTNNVSFAIHIS